MDCDFTCCLCGSKDGVSLVKNSDIRFSCFGSDKAYILCGKCNVIQLYPQWSDEELSALYYKYNSKKDFSNYKPKKEIRYYLDQYIKGKKKILEIGCGHGHDLRRHYGKGYNIIGIDKDSSVCDGKMILNYGLEDLPSGIKYDLIYAIHLFEHIKDPDTFIEDLKKRLEDGGELMLEIPSAKDPLLSLYDNSGYKKFYWYPFHLYYYDQNSIRDLFLRHGMKVEVSLRQRYGILNHLRWIFLNRPGNWHPHVPLIDFLYKLYLTKILGISDTMIIRWKK